MANTSFKLRFNGIDNLYGANYAAIIANSNICLLGTGGVGSWCAEALARSGVGKITLIDPDDCCVSNINRQLPALTNTVGKAKIKVLKKRIVAINPNCQVKLVEEFISAANCAKLLTNNYHMVIDTIDNAKHKAHVIAHCKRHKIPIVTTGAAGGKRDPGKIKVVDLSRTTNDPLAAKVRNNLRRKYGFSRNQKRSFSVPCIYSSEQINYPQSCGETSQTKTFAKRNISLDCEGSLGASTMVTGSFGFSAAATAIEKIIHKHK